MQVNNKLPVTIALWRAPHDTTFAFTFSTLGASRSLGRVWINGWKEKKTWHQPLFSALELILHNYMTIWSMLPAGNYGLTYWSSIQLIKHTSAWSAPIPNCPNWFPPNEYTSPSADIQTVCHSPAATLSIRIPSNEDTHVGLNSSSVHPCPHCNKLSQKYSSSTRNGEKLSKKEQKELSLFDWTWSWSTSRYLFLHHFLLYLHIGQLSIKETPADDGLYRGSKYLDCKWSGHGKWKPGRKEKGSIRRKNQWIEICLAD